MRGVGLLACLTAAAGRAQDRPHADSTRFVRLLEFPATDTTATMSARLGPGLRIAIRREVDAQGVPMGWGSAVQSRPGGRNLLYHSRYLHGAHPADLFAWHHLRGEFPDERILPGYGYPYEVRLRCIGCRTEGDSVAVHFVRGTVEVAVRRLAKTNPPAFARGR